MKPNTLLPVNKVEIKQNRRIAGLSPKILLPISLLLMAWFLNPQSLSADIWEPEGLNLPGGWNSWTNPPTDKLALASATQVSGGRVIKITTGIARWQTIFSVAASGADLVGGSYPFVFSSGSISNPWGNTWKDVTVSMNNLQTYTFQGINNNQITVENGKWYTMNWKDSGYDNTQAIFMVTSAQPVAISSVVVPPIGVPSTPVTVSITASGNLCPEEIIYLRYSTDSWLTSGAIPFVMTGNSGTVAIPGQAAGKTISCYAFSSTLTGITSDYDMKSIRINNNGGANYSIPVGNSVPSVTTGTISALGGTSASIGGSVLSDGGTAVTARGVCWSTDADPTLDDTFTTSGSGTGNFTSVLSNLNPGTTYHARAYATNSSGTAYGSDVQFTCLSSVTFLLDVSTLNGYVPASDQVYISGSFADAYWNEPGSNPALLMIPLQAGGTNLSLTLFLSNGTYAFKYFKNSGWIGGEWSGESNRSIVVSGNTTVNSIWGGEISNANLQWPANGTVPAGELFNVYARVTIPNGLTGVPGGAYGMHAWIGYGTTDTDPVNWTTWIPATFNAASGTSDEYVANLGSSISSPGVYYYASRFQAGSGPFSYGGYNAGFWNGTTNVSGTLTVTPSQAFRSLNVKVFLERLYPGGNSMNKAQNASGDQYSGTIADKVTVELHSLTDYSVIVFASTDLDLTTDGMIQLSNIPSVLNASYYLTIKHRNSIETTSATAISLATLVSNYDFTTAASQAYSSNQKNVNGKFCIYSGDINQDGLVNTLDKAIAGNEVAAFTEGYVSSDLNGDGLCDTSDEIIIDNNSRQLVSSKVPQ